MIHSTAIIDPKAKIGQDVSIGAYAYVGPNVTLGKGTQLHHHATVDGWTEIGENVQIFPYAAIGGVPQDLKYKGEKCVCRVGDRTVLREFVTINAGSESGHATEVGSDCLLMAYCHLGHNACVKNHVIMANSATLAGHVTIDEYAVIGGLVGIHQYVKIGKMCIVGGCSKVVKDIPPFMLADGNPTVIRSINKIGLQRRGLSTEKISRIKNAFKLLYRSGLNFTQALEKIELLGNDKEVLEIVDFVKNSERGIAKGGK